MLALVLLTAMQVTATGTSPDPGRVAVAAAFVPARPGTPASVAVTFTPQDPEVRVNQEPAPRLKLDSAQAILDHRPPPRRHPATAEPETPHYLEPAIPYAFAVTLKPGAPKGEHRVKATVTYFYCSKSAGWCRKGSGEVDVPVTVP